MVASAIGIFLAAAGLKSCRWLVKTWLSLVWLRGWSSDTGSATEPLVLVLPAFREQTLVHETLVHFASLDYPLDSYRIVVVTNQLERRLREEAEETLEEYATLTWKAMQSVAEMPLDLLTGHLPGSQVTRLWRERESFHDQQTVFAAVQLAFAASPVTADLVEVEAKGLNDRCGIDLIVHVEYTGPELHKVGQVRFVLDHVQDILHDWDRIDQVRYVGVYDFDSRLHHPAGLQMISRACGVAPQAIQQIALPTPRFRTTISKRDRIFAIADGLGQMRRALGIETWNLLYDRWLERHVGGVKRQLLRSSAYAIGIGLFMRLEGLSKIGGLPDRVDDLGVGWKLSYVGERIEPVRAPVSYEAYATPLQARRSREFIYMGYLGGPKEYLRLPNRSRGSAFILMRVAWHIVNWPLGPAMAAIALSVAWLVFPWWAAGTAAILYLNAILAGAIAYRAWSVFGLMPPLRPLELVAAFVLSPLHVFWAGAGPRRVLARRLLGRRGDAFRKTER